MTEGQKREEMMAMEIDALKTDAKLLNNDYRKLVVIAKLHSEHEIEYQRKICAGKSREVNLMATMKIYVHRELELEHELRNLRANIVDRKHREEELTSMLLQNPKIITE